MRWVKRLWLVAAIAFGLGGCGSGGANTTPPGVAEGGLSPEQTVETFLVGATDAMRYRAVGNFTDADRAYERMAAVFGTERGSVHRTMSAEEVRNRMIVLSACLRPASHRIIAESDFASRQSGQASVTVELSRGKDTLTLPFRIVIGPEDRWFIDRIDLSAVTC